MGVGEVTSVEVAGGYSDRPDDFLKGSRATIHDPSTGGILHEDARPPSSFRPYASFEMTGAPRSVATPRPSSETSSYRKPLSVYLNSIDRRQSLSTFISSIVEETWMPTLSMFWMLSMDNAFDAAAASPFQHS